MRQWPVIALTTALLSASATLADDVAPSGDPPPVCTKDGSPVADNYLQLARDILTVTKTNERMAMTLDAVMPAMLAMVRKTTPDMSDETLATFKTALREEMLKSVPDLIAVEACVYTQHFSIEELGQLSQFYKDPLGQKLLTETPAIFKENLAIGQAWGLRAGRAAMGRVLAKFRKNGEKT